MTQELRGGCLAVFLDLEDHNLKTENKTKGVVMNACNSLNWETAEARLLQV